MFFFQRNSSPLSFIECFYSSFSVFHVSEDFEILVGLDFVVVVFFFVMGARMVM